MKVDYCSSVNHPDGQRWKWTEDIAGQNVVIIDEVNSERLYVLGDIFLEAGAIGVRFCVLVDDPAIRREDCVPDFAGAVVRGGSRWNPLYSGGPRVLLRGQPTPRAVKTTFQRRVAAVCVPEAFVGHAIVDALLNAHISPVLVIATNAEAISLAEESRSRGFVVEARVVGDRMRDGVELAEALRTHQVLALFASPLRLRGHPAEAVEFEWVVSMSRASTQNALWQIGLAERVLLLFTPEQMQERDALLASGTQVDFLPEDGWHAARWLHFFIENA
jgi:hypothetical protein